MQEMCVLSLDQEDPLEKEMAIHSSILAWGIPRTASLAGYSPCVQSWTRLKPLSSTHPSNLSCGTQAPELVGNSCGMWA